MERKRKQKRKKIICTERGREKRKINMLRERERKIVIEIDR